MGRRLISSWKAALIIGSLGKILRSFLEILDLFVRMNRCCLVALVVRRLGRFGYEHGLKIWKKIELTKITVFGYY